jgi:DnaJ like chaperone protein
MKIWGKIVGGTAGFALGGPIAGLLGVMAGHAVDRYVLDNLASNETAPAVRDPNAPFEDHPGLRQIAFTIGVIALGAKMAGVDGEVTRQEVDAFRGFFQIPPGEERSVERFFNLAKRDPSGFEPYAKQVAALFPDAPEILEHVLEGLFDIAKADGEVTAEEANYLAQVARLFGLDSNRFERAKAAALGVVECEPCVILGIDPLATDEQIREAWLRQVRANHPDRLIAQGLPEEAIAIANRKLALINDAYDRLRRERAAA